MAAAVTQEWIAKATTLERRGELKEKKKKLSAEFQELKQTPTPDYQEALRNFNEQTVWIVSQVSVERLASS